MIPKLWKNSEFHRQFFDVEIEQPFYISKWVFWDARNWRIDEVDWDARDWQFDPNDIKTRVGAEHYSQKNFGFEKIEEYLQKSKHSHDEECCINCRYFDTCEHSIRCPEFDIELIRRVDPRTINTDLPDDLHNVAQGHANPQNPHIDEKEPRRTVFDMWGSYRTISAVFRDDAVKMNNRVYPLYRKSSIDVLPTYHTRPETLQNWEANKWVPSENRWKKTEFKTVKEDAFTLSELAQKMNLNYCTMQKLIFGYMHSDGEWRHGIHIFDEEEIADFLFEQETMLDKIDEPDPKLEQERQFYYDLSNRLIEKGAYNAPFTSVTGQMKYIEHMASQAIIEYENDEPDPRNLSIMVEKGFGDPLVTIESLDSGENKPVYEDDLDNQQYEDEMGDEVSDDGWSAFALHYGEDAPDWEFVLEIKKAGIVELNRIKKKFFKQEHRSFYGTYTTPAELWYLTPEQKSICWWYINRREEHIVSAIKKYMSKEAKEVMDFLPRLPQHQSKALIQCFRYNDVFEAYDKDFDFTEREIEMPWHCYEVWVLWHEWKKIGKGTTR